MKNKLSPAIVCGFGAAVLGTIPGVKSFGCCLLLPAATMLSLYLYLRITFFHESVTAKTAMFIGLITGLFSAFFSGFFDLLITYIFHTNDIVFSLPQVELLISTYNLGDIGKETIAILRNMSNEITTNGFSLTYTFFLLFNNIIIDSLFGVIGGLIGMSIFNKKYFTKL
ncbi:MAG: hypothetical protein COW85_06085 [Ignavibacteria bacterium CG22_combo_CG10-13_8_21_14_all_37_15]|nr:MAG: hypothetical protein COW85_06085 [Ignavibacteria bacterium CG22_combo_CG10-13_8_21_14_all_37_15]